MGRLRTRVHAPYDPSFRILSEMYESELNTALSDTRLCAASQTRGHLINPTVLCTVLHLSVMILPALGPSAGS